MAITSTYSIYCKEDDATLYSLTIKEFGSADHIYDVIALNKPLLESTIIQRGAEVFMPIYKDIEKTTTQIIEAKDPW